MKQYVIDEIRSTDLEKIKAYFDANFEYSGIEKLYWIAIDKDMLTDNQAVHTQCHPFYFAVDVLPERLNCELLVRTRNRIRCSCMDYATEKQRNWFINLVDTIFDKLAITI
jgi:hypothetical protein